MLPRQFGHYHLESLLGTGGMGEVYLAEDTQRGRKVALKLLPDIYADDEEYLSRFRRESYVAARLRDPHVIPIHDFGEIDDRLYIDMRLVEGRDIRAILDQEGPMRPARAVHLIAQVAEALDAAHADGLVHRDIKPSNVLVTAKDFVYVVDFGIARTVGPARTSLTITGTTVGSLDYMAPERFLNDPIDHRTDVYSLACLLYECLTGARPFRGHDLPSLMYAHLYGEPPQASAAGNGTPALDAVIERGLAKEPVGRFSSAGELAGAARAALTQPRPVPSPVAPPEITTPEMPRGVPRRAASSAASPVATREPAPIPGSQRSPEPQSSPLVASSATTGRRGLTIAAVAVLVVLLGGVLAYFLTRPGAPPPGAPDTSPNVVAAADIAASIAVPTVAGSIPVGATPGYVQVAPNGRFAYICNRDAGVVTVLDTTLNQVTATIPVPQGPPQFVSFAPDSKTAYVSIYNNDRTVNLVAFLDTATNSVTSTVPVGRRPFASATTPDGSILYVPSHDDGRLEVIDTASAKVIGQIPVAHNPHWVAFSPDGRFFYTANHESNLLTVLDAATRGIVTEIPVGTSPHSTEVAPDGKRVSVVNFGSNDVSVIDTSTNTVVATVPVGKTPQDIAYAPDGRFFYVASVDASTVSVVDAATNKVTATIPSNGGPTSVSVLPNGRQAYVTDLNTGQLMIINLSH